MEDTSDSEDRLSLDELNLWEPNSLSRRANNLINNKLHHQNNCHRPTSTSKISSSSSYESAYASKAKTDSGNNTRQQHQAGNSIPTHGAQLLLTTHYDPESALQLVATSRPGQTTVQTITPPSSPESSTSHHYHRHYHHSTRVSSTDNQASTQNHHCSPATILCPQRGPKVVLLLPPPMLNWVLY